MSRYRSAAATSRRRMSSSSRTASSERQIRRSITVHDISSNEGYYYIESGDRFSASRNSARTNQVKKRSKSFSLPEISTENILRALAVIARIVAFFFVMVVLVNALMPGSARVALLSITSTITHLIPSVLAGLYVFQSPFGGAFRGDIALVAIILFVVDWLLCKFAASLR